MTKLTVAEASKRGYATGLSILQAVQKDWLRAEKGADGQLIVDTVDLERLFGRPSGPSAPSIPVGSPSAPITDAADRLEIDDDREDDFDDEEDFDDSGGEEGDALHTDASAVTPPVPVSGAEPDDSSGDAAGTVHRPADRAVALPSAEREALLAEIAELRDALAAEQRRVTALLDVLATRVLPPNAAANDGDSVADHDDMAAATDEQTGTATAVPSSPAAEETEAAPMHEAERLSETSGNVPADTGDRDDEEDEAPDITVPPVAEYATPRLTADPDARRTEPASATSRYHNQDSGRDRALFWQVWVLVSLVWIVLIGAFLWYLGGLGNDLWVVAEWLRGERTADTPEFAEATGASLRAARDIFVPPAALLALMLIVRAAFRKMRQR